MKYFVSSYLQVNLFEENIVILFLNILMFEVVRPVPKQHL